MTLQKRLEWCMRNGNLTVADLARWFGRPHATVREWVYNGRQFSAPWLDLARLKALLQDLENRIRKKRDFPVPTLSPTARIAYLNKVRASI